MGGGMGQFSVALSKLVAGKKNPRPVTPEQEAFGGLVASIKAHGLLQLLVVRAGRSPSRTPLLPRTAGYRQCG
jgi:ParB-like chromosome segregation protein Spo0J